MMMKKETFEPRAEEEEEDTLCCTLWVRCESCGPLRGFCGSKHLSNMWSAREERERGEPKKTSHRSPILTIRVNFTLEFRRRNVGLSRDPQVATFPAHPSSLENSFFSSGFWGRGLKLFFQNWNQLNFSFCFGIFLLAVIIFQNVQMYHHHHVSLCCMS